jgi:hypothetical protein
LVLRRIQDFTVEEPVIIQNYCRRLGPSMLAASDCTIVFPSLVGWVWPQLVRMQDGMLVGALASVINSQLSHL